MEERENKTSRAQLDAIKKYHSKFIRTRFYCTPEMKADIDAYCEKHGINVTEFLRRAVVLQLKEE